MIFLNLEKLSDNEFIEYVLKQMPDEETGILVRGRIGSSKKEVLAYKQLYRGLERWVENGRDDGLFPPI